MTSEDLHRVPEHALHLWRHLHAPHCKLLELLQLLVRRHGLLVVLECKEQLPFHLSSLFTLTLGKVLVASVRVGRERASLDLWTRDDVSGSITTSVIP